MKALISVSDKTGIVDFCKNLSDCGIELISTGGTFDLLTQSGLSVENVLDLTEYKKPVDSIIKTLYPEIYAGISANRNDNIQMKQLANCNISPIDFVVVNLFPFESFSENTTLSVDDCLDYIDIGGPTMLRSAAKSYKNIVVVSDLSDYPLIIKELKSNGNVSTETRKYLMKKVFTATANYDVMISKFIDKNL